MKSGDNIEEICRTIKGRLLIKQASAELLQKKFHSIRNITILINFKLLQLRNFLLNVAA